MKSSNFSKYRCKQFKNNNSLYLNHYFITQHQEFLKKYRLDESVGIKDILSTVLLESKGAYHEKYAYFILYR